MLKNVKRCLRTSLTAEDTTHLLGGGGGRSNQADKKGHSWKQENTDRNEACHSHSISNQCLKGYICQNKVCKAFGTQANKKRRENGNICLSF